MPDRARQNAACYLVHDLHIDWRLGAQHFQQSLLDYDEASNWANWAMVAATRKGRAVAPATGLTAVAQERRVDVTEQSYEYDPVGAYVRRWVPELRDAPGMKLYEPWTLSDRDLAKYVCPTYPKAIRTDKIAKYLAIG